MSTSFQRFRVQGGVLLGALTSVALAAGSLSSGTPAANATCASFFGIGNSADCTSNLTSIAIGIGTGARAQANGLFSAAYSIGTASQSLAGIIPFIPNAFCLSVVAGDSAAASSGGVFGVAAQLGRYGQAGATGALNLAVNVAPGAPALYGSQVSASGIGDVAVNLFGTGTELRHWVDATGNGTFAANLGGNNNRVIGLVGTLTTAFNIFGSGNDVMTGPGPLAVAGSILQTGQRVQQYGPGFNINGVKVPNTAAAVSGTRAAAATAPTVLSGKSESILRNGRKIEKAGLSFNINGLRLPDTAAAVGGTRAAAVTVGGARPAAATAPAGRASRGQ